ncbi:hypothetical protein BDR05DRAFT_966404, partial [Suillus weaverae]
MTTGGSTTVSVHESTSTYFLAIDINTLSHLHALVRVAILISFLQPSQPNVPPTTAIRVLPGHAYKDGTHYSWTCKALIDSISRNQFDHIPNLNNILYSILYIELTFFIHIMKPSIVVVAPRTMHSHVAWPTTSRNRGLGASSCIPTRTTTSESQS